MTVQGTPEWYAERLGKVTASRISDVVARTKTGWGASRANYAAELAAERLSGCPTERFTSAAMQWGIETEAAARREYAFMTGRDVEQIGFVAHPNILMSGASPDGMVGDDGLVEIKCPNSATHIETLLGGDIQKKYLLQMQWQMVCTGRTWCDFVSFDPRMPEDMQMHITRVHRDDEMIAQIEQNVIEFLEELGDTVDALVIRYRAAARAA